MSFLQSKGRDSKGVENGEGIFINKSSKRPNGKDTNKRKKYVYIYLCKKSKREERMCLLVYDNEEKSKTKNVNYYLGPLVRHSQVPGLSVLLV